MIAIFLITILIVLICVLLYLFTHLIFELKSKNDNLKKISQCPDCNIKCPVVKGCEPCETCPNDKPITTESTNILFDSSGNEPDLTPINFDDILNDLPFDDDLPERRFDVGRDKENAIEKAKQYLTTPAPAENIIAEQFILKENFISKWTPVGKEPTILLPTIKPFQSLKD